MPRGDGEEQDGTTQGAAELETTTEEHLYTNEMEQGPEQENLQPLETLPAFNPPLPPETGPTPTPGVETNATVGLVPDVEAMAENMAEEFGETGVTLPDIREMFQYEQRLHPNRNPTRIETLIRIFFEEITPDEANQITADRLSFSDVFKLWDEHTHLTITNTIQALEGPPGTTPRVIGGGVAGADIQFVDQDGNVVLSREIETTQGTFNTFQNRIRNGAAQVEYNGNVYVQVPDGTDAKSWFDRFRGLRSDLSKYQKVTITIVDQDGNVLYNGPIVP